MNIKKDVYVTLIDVIRRSNFTCSQPVEVDYDEYVACEKCSNCLDRKRLQETGIKEFEHIWK